MSKGKFDAGKWAENEADTWMRERAASELGFAHHRFPDARAARGALAAQPADFLVARKHTLPDGTVVKRTWFLEVKETANERRLPRAKIGQYGKLKVFAYAGVTPLVLVYSSHFKAWCLLNAVDLFDHDEAPASFVFHHKQMFPTCGAILTEIFK